MDQDVFDYIHRNLKCNILIYVEKKRKLAKRREDRNRYNVGMQQWIYNF